MFGAGIVGKFLCEQIKGLTGNGLLAHFFSAFALKKPGDISPVVETTFGYHVIRLAERQPRKSAVYEEHRAQLLADAEREYRSAEFLKLVKKMVLDENPKADEDAVARLKFNVDINDLIKKNTKPASAAGK